LEIHKIFNESYYLEEKEAPSKEICEAHSKYIQYYCMECWKEICFKCVVIGEKHKEHKFIPFITFKKIFSRN